MNTFPRQRPPDTSETIQPEPRILTNARTVVDLLTATANEGLPAPRYVTFHDDFRQIGIQLASPAEVTAWAAWFNRDVSTEGLGDDEPGAIHRVNGKWADFAVQVYHVEYGEAAA